MRVKFLGLSIVFLLLAGCAGQGEVGDGPLVLSPEVKRFYKQYLKQAGESGRFAVAEDGNFAGATYCPKNEQCHSASSTRAIGLCQGNPSNSRCKIFAVGHSIVWRGFDESQL
jgi:hypothetical protein